MKKTSGFTLIEVMVATAVLLIMALMMGAMFRQASSAWDSGYAKAEGGMIVRAIVGSLERDLAGAVDARRFGKNEPFSKSGDLWFVTLKEIVLDNGEIYREPHLITYTQGTSVRRTDQPMKVGSKTFGSGETAVLYENNYGAAVNNGSTFNARITFVRLGLPPEADTNPASSDSDRDSFGETAVNAETESSLAWSVPAVKVRVELTQAGSFAGLTVDSAGPDGVFADSSGSGEAPETDDIVVR